MSKQPPPAHTASAIGPYPTIFKLIGRPGILYEHICDDNNNLMILMIMTYRLI